MAKHKPLWANPSFPPRFLYFVENRSIVVLMKQTREKNERRNPKIRRPMRAGMKTLISTLLAACFLLPGCVPEAEVLSGWWHSRAPSAEPDESVLPDIGIELIVGHYGPDVAGIVRLYQGQFSGSDYKGHNHSSYTCPCSYIENGRYHSDGRFSFRFAVACLPESLLLEPNETGDVVVELELTDENTLVGKLSTLGGTSIQPVRFVRDRDDEFISEGDKICDL